MESAVHIVASILNDMAVLHLAALIPALHSNCYATRSTCTGKINDNHRDGECHNDDDDEELSVTHYRLQQYQSTGQDEYITYCNMIQWYNELFCSLVWSLLVH
jgi:hypothetical protein